MNQFEVIFSILPRNKFKENPTQLLPLMSEFGFEDRLIRMLGFVFSEDLNEVMDYFNSPDKYGPEIIKRISDQCLVSEAALGKVLSSIKDALKADIPSKTIVDKSYGKCLVSDEGDAYYSLDMKTLLYVNPDVLSFKIPDFVEYVDCCAFFGCSSIKELIIPNSILEIGDNAFCECRSLTEVDLPNSLNSIGESAFEDCTSLKTVKIPHSTTSIGSRAFAGCTSLEYVSIKGPLSVIKNHIFERCISLKEANVPSSVVKIEDYAFAGCISLEHVNLPDRLRTIGCHAFEDCSTLSEICISCKAKQIGEYAFAGCKSLVLQDTILPPIDKIGRSTFEDCSSLSVLYLSNDTEYVCSNAFSGCTSLKWIDLGKGLKSIGDYAFEGCISLKELVIPPSVKSIGDFAFAHCDILAHLDLNPIFVTIGEYAFLNCHELQGMLATSMFDAAPNTFDNCYRIQILDNGSYYDNRLISSVDFGNEHLTRYGRWIVHSYHYLDNAIAYGSCSYGDLYETENNEFDCFTLTDGTDYSDGVVYIPDYYTAIGSYAFAYNDNIREIILPNSIVEIDDHAFCNCRNLESIVFPKKIEHIGEDAFYGCKILKTTIITSKVLELSDNPFHGCSSISVELGSGDWCCDDIIAECKYLTFSEFDKIDIEIYYSNLEAI